MTSQLLITYVLLSVLKLDPNNPRVHTPRQIRQISRSLQAFGFIVPILVDAFYRIIAGHGRYLAAGLLRMPEVPIIMIEHLTPAQLEAFQIADNALSDNSDWGKVQLGLNLKHLSVDNIDLLEVTGLDTAIIDLAIEQFETSTMGDEDHADDIVETLQNIPVSQAGDIWSMGNHRLMCGDARNLSDFRRLMGKRKARTAFIDVPYNVRIAGHVSGKGSIVHREFEMAAGEMSSSEYTAFLTESFGPLTAFCVDGSLHYVCIDSQHMGEVLAAGRDVYDCLKACCIWVKDNAGMGSLYRSQHEMIFVFKSGTAPHRNNIELGRHGRTRTNVWKYPGANSFSGRNTDEGNLLALHPTVKPVQLVADAILDSTARGDIVIDSFIGSGSTLIAAERTGRFCYGVELDPLYLDVTIRRWQRHTGAHAIHAVSGKRFDDVAGGAHA